MTDRAHSYQTTRKS